MLAKKVQFNIEDLSQYALDKDTLIELASLLFSKDFSDEQKKEEFNKALTLHVYADGLDSLDKAIAHLSKRILIDPQVCDTWRKSLFTGSVEASSDIDFNQDNLNLPILSEHQDRPVERTFINRFNPQDFEQQTHRPSQIRASRVN